MGKYCADCTYFKTSEKKGEGVCKCTKNGKFMPGNAPRCDKFGEAYCRGWYEKEKLYDDGKKAANKPTPSNISTGTYLFFAIILVVIALLINIFK